MERYTLAGQATPFLNYIEDWMAALTVLPIEDASPEPSKTAILSVDITNGFCYEGPLASPRVASIVEPVKRLFERAWDHGVRDIVLSQDTHDPQAVEFAQWPAHCVRDTREAETVAAFKALPFFNQVTIIEKNSIQSGISHDLIIWLNQHSDIDTFIITGDCTDLCTYQLAMHLRMYANEHQLTRRVIVPANCVQTYDRPVEVAQAQGGLPHPGDLMHAIFLYHMALNGIEVVAEIA